MSTSKEKINQRNAEGKQEGLWELYHFNGELCFKGNYVNGKRNGYWESYWDNGELYSKGNLINGEQKCLWKIYNIEGFLTKEIFYVNI